MLNSNFHTHTFRCGHADGEDEEYVLQALGMGLQQLGFSDHIMYPGYNEPRIRGTYSLNQGYLNSVRELSLKYKDRIKIFCGYEAECYVPYIPYMKELLATGTIDYMILGNHSAMNDRHQIYARFGKATSASNIYMYGKTACAAMRTGLYSYIAHPDLFLSDVKEFDNDCKKVSIDIIKTAIECDVPLEINCGGIRSGKKQIGDEFRYHYPTYDFFKLASKMKAKCIIGIDAHSPTQLSNDDTNAIALKFAKELSLQLVDRIQFKKVSL